MYVTAIEPTGAGSLPPDQLAGDFDLAEECAQEAFAAACGIGSCPFMTNAEEENIDLVRTYFNALQNGEAGDALRRFFTDDVRQVEMPNQLNQCGQESDLEHILQRSRQGLKVLQRQQFEIVSAMAQDSRVAVEARWSGVLAVALGTLAAGTEMKASFAIFFHFRDGRIALQRNYDCFDPW